MILKMKTALTMKMIPQKSAQKNEPKNEESKNKYNPKNEYNPKVADGIWKGVYL